MLNVNYLYLAIILDIK